MRKTILLFFMIVVCSATNAQEATRSISIEGLGAQNMLGVNYDARIKGNSGWGYRAGLGWSYGMSSDFWGNEENTNGISAPLEVNNLLGKKNHHLELGAGISLGYYHQNITDAYVNQTTGEIMTYKHKENKFGYFLFGDIGYRYQRPSGFMFRAGISPSFNFGDKHGVSKSWCYPYIGLGWSF